MGLKDVLRNIKGILSFASLDSVVRYLRENVGAAGLYDYSLERYRHGQHHELGPVDTIMRILAVR
jgi:hypothetical protein